MIFRQRHAGALLISAVLACVAGVAIRAGAEAPLTPIQARADMDILQQALTTLHPGLNRYLKPEDVGPMFEGLRAEFAAAQDSRAQFLAVSRVLARIRCGHTFCNFLNQPEDIKKALFEGKDRVPFAFRFVNRRMVVTLDATAAGTLPPGTEVRAINGEPVDAIVARLMALVKADGGNDGKRVKDLEVSGGGSYEPFDIYYANAYAPVPETFRFSAILPGETEAREVSGVGLTRDERRQTISARYPKTQSESPWRFEILDGGVGYLRIGTFVTRGLDINWRDFLKTSFGQLKSKKVANLIVDIRGNEGGDDAIGAALLRYLLSAPVSLGPRRELLRYEAVPETLAPHLNTWDESFKDRRGKLVPADQGFYTWKNARPGPVEYRPGGDAYEGKVYLLVDASNSSGTFHVAQVLSEDPRTTLVGQTTGGNRRGTNGSQLFFLRLPNSGIEVDIPLVGVFPNDEQPDAGIEPDVAVAPTVDAIVKGIDEEVAMALKLIGR